jgi:hypothetical protein
MTDSDSRDHVENSFESSYKKVTDLLNSGANIESVEDADELADAVRYEFSIDSSKVRDAVSSSKTDLGGVTLAGYIAVKVGSGSYTREKDGTIVLGGEEKLNQYLVEEISKQARSTSEPAYIVHVYDLVARSGMHSYLGDAKNEILPISLGIFENVNESNWDENERYLYKSIVGCTLQTLYALYSERSDLDLAADLGIQKKDLEEITDQLRGVPPTLVMQSAGDFIGMLESNERYKTLGEKFLSLRSNKGQS